MKRLIALILCSAWLSSGVMYAEQAQPTQTQPPAVPDTAREPEGLISEPVAIERAVLFGDRHLGDGERPTVSTPTSATWCRAPAGFPSDPATAGGSAMTTRSSTRRPRSRGAAYKTAQARFEMPKLLRSRIALGSQIQVAGLGRARTSSAPGLIRSDSTAATYRLRSTDIVGYATFRPARKVEVGASVWRC